MKSTTNLDIWYHYNEPALQYLYNYLINLSKNYGLNINNSTDSYSDFVNVMYNESNGYLIDPIDCQEFIY